MHTVHACQDEMGEGILRFRKRHAFPRRRNWTCAPCSGDRVGAVRRHWRRRWRPREDGQQRHICRWRVLFRGAATATPYFRYSLQLHFGCVLCCIIPILPFLFCHVLAFAFAYTRLNNHTMVNQLNRKAKKASTSRLFPELVSVQILHLAISLHLKNALTSSLASSALQKYFALFNVHSIILYAHAQKVSYRNTKSFSLSLWLYFYLQSPPSLLFVT